MRHKNAMTLVLAFGMCLASAVCFAQKANAPKAEEPFYIRIQESAFPTSYSTPEPPDPNYLYRVAIKEIANRHLYLCGKSVPPNTNEPMSNFLRQWQDPPSELKSLEDADKAIEKALAGLGARFDSYLVPKDVEAEKKMRDPTLNGVIGVDLTVKGLPKLAKQLKQAKPNITNEEILETLTISDEHPLRLTPLPESPAEKAGLLENDSVKVADGKILNGLSCKQAVAQMRGKIGSTLNLIIERNVDGKSQELQFKVERGAYRTPAALDKHFENKIGYVNLTTFMDDKADADMEAALKRILQRGDEMLLFDLRDNGGGQVDIALNIASYLMPEGTILVLRKRERKLDASSDQIVEVRYSVTPHVILQTSEDGSFIRPNIKKHKLIVPPEMPIMVLTNKWSASASEILAGALQFNGRAETVGMRTLGKSEMQAVVPLPYERSMHITISEFRPKDINIDFLGIGANHRVGQDEEDEENSIDTQLEEAKKLIVQKYNNQLKEEEEKQEADDAVRAKKQKEWERLHKQIEEEKLKEEDKDKDKK